MKVMVMFRNFGPYHYARLNDLASYCDLCGVEFFDKDDTYDWKFLDKKIRFEKQTLFEHGLESRCSISCFFKRIISVLSSMKPDVVVLPGWSERVSLATLLCCLELNIPCVLMSDSTEEDFTRHWFKEFVKKRLVSKFTSGLVAGTPHVKYLNKLGMPVVNIFTGYDVVDNLYFHTNTNRIRNDVSIRSSLGLPSRYFLASCRFVEKKNLTRLINAYKIYFDKNQSKSWELVLLGDGELRSELEILVDKLGLRGRILMPGFIDYKLLPNYYAFASAFVHASTTEQWGLVVNEAMASGLPVLVSNRCGCAQDLVHEGVNGFSFNPLNISALANLMNELTLDPKRLEAMGGASLNIIKNWTPKTFSEGLLMACRRAIDHPQSKFRFSFVEKFILKALCRR